MKLANSATLRGNAVVDRLSGGPWAWSSMPMPTNPGKLDVEATAFTVSCWKGEPVGWSSKTCTISSGKLSRLLSLGWGGASAVLRQFAGRSVSAVSSNSRR